MFSILFSFFLAFVCPNHNNINPANPNNGPQITIMGDGETGGETGTVPPRKP
ncbi:hypothetical protein LX64_02938 [Chitinophaga skermanii]|uniref:Uncharacterized protein n=1 Tax=Chitinophaga skermanii TaxID=331697 RepID=A0A327QIC7_9BACT|nr:hypothetical protein [Chitinophaga skermanii]RAJ04061.1 hypothetical protein LX64_02938 [Chitinophaga skermanii]